MPLWVRAGMPMAASSDRMRPRTASASALPTGWGRSGPRTFASSLSARAAENCRAGASAGSAIGRQGLIADSSQIAATSAARLIMRAMPPPRPQAKAGNPHETQEIQVIS